ncbi:hypothetical protein WICPIJ_002282 [Wickerhamomyces pijperi]|uniref:Protein-serine/threonine kinase n=1 Tax=Wickerhamomyces pijperi TaxID=599730 RepID=A0A9P8QC67_WICPI|nr:hypothetical protein WICPIJ_002282 [Wickerhamomyces pijperi]
MSRLIPFRRFLTTTTTALQLTHHTKPAVESKLKHHLSLSFEKEYKIRSSLETLISDYSAKKVPPITLDSLIELSKHRDDQLSKQTLNYLTYFNVKRLKAFRSLPYLVVLNPHISSTYQSYLKSLELLLNISGEQIKNDELIYDTLTQFYDIHSDAIPSLSKGFQEVSIFYPKSSIVEFLNRHFHDKINMDIIANNYIQAVDTCSQKDHIGIVGKALHISELIKVYAGFVNDMTFIKYYKQVPVKITAGEDITFPYIGQHLEYVITEILKNSIRSHIENDRADTAIQVTISQSKEGSKSTLGIRFRDEGNGIPPEIERNIFDYSFTSVTKQDKNKGMADNSMPGEDIDTVAGMGYGLPLTKAYVEQFGGSLDIQSVYGFGTDVYIELVGPDETKFDD